MKERQPKKVYWGVVNDLGDLDRGRSYLVATEVKR